MRVFSDWLRLIANGDDRSNSSDLNHQNLFIINSLISRFILFFTLFTNFFFITLLLEIK